MIMGSFGPYRKDEIPCQGWAQNLSGGSNVVPFRAIHHTRSRSDTKGPTLGVDEAS